MSHLSVSNRQSGFTLVEMLIVVAIVAIIGSIAVPSYQGYMMRSKRTDATSTLVTAQQLLERCFTEKGSYAHADCPSDAELTTAVNNHGNYTITTGTRAATTYLITATATSTHGQNKDTDCNKFTLSSTGVKKSFPSGSTTANSYGTCWK